MTGAARVAARAAARVGAGLTTIAVSMVAFPIYAASLTSVMVHPLSEPGDFHRLLDEKRYTAFHIGPGAGTGEETRDRVLLPEMLPVKPRRKCVALRASLEYC